LCLKGFSLLLNIASHCYSYVLLLSDNGWMTSDIFEAWLANFIRVVKQRPIVLVLDGHKTHIGINVIKLAMENGIWLLKLPSHSTDKLQPLDVSVFRPLKAQWNKALAEYQRAIGFRQLSKGETVNLLSGVWYKALTPPNIIHGFRKSGIYPVNRNEYPRDVFNPLQLLSYQTQFPETATTLPAPTSTAVAAATEGHQGASTSSFNLSATPTTAPADNVTSPSLQEVCKSSGTGKSDCSISMIDWRYGK
jgi:hypothetical protein